MPCQITGVRTRSSKANTANNDTTAVQASEGKVDQGGEVTGNNQHRETETPHVISHKGDITGE